MKKIREKCIAFVIGLILIALLLEISLRISGTLYYNKSHADKRTSEQGAYTILCLGDSYTYGLGAPPDQSYPRQLEKILNQISKTKKFIVVNRGQPAQNSTQLLRELPNNLETVKPELVVLMTGVANDWNHTGFNAFLKNRGLTYKLQEVVYQTRVYKLAKLINLNLKDKIYNIRFSKTSEVKPGDYNNQGWIYLNTHNYPAALRWFEEALRSNPKDSNSYNGLGKYYEMTNNNEKAIASYKKALSLNPGDTNCIPDLARLYAKTAGQEQAINLLNKALQRAPRDPKIYHTLGSIYTETRDYAQALNAFKKAIELEPNNSHNYNGMGQVYFKQKINLTEAAKCFKKAVEINPQDPDSYINLGQLYSEEYKADQAITWFKQGIKINPESAKNYLGIGDVYFLNQNYPEALKWFFKSLKIQALRMEPSAWEIYYKIGLIYQLQKKFNQAIKFYRPALKLEPNCSSIVEPRIFACQKQESLGTFSVPDPRDEGKKVENLPPLEAWLASDLEEIIKIAESRHIKVILMAHPSGINIDKYHCSWLLKDIAEKQHIPFIDNQVIFKDLNPNENYMATDGGHPNAKGYKVIAQNLSEEIIKLQKTENRIQETGDRRQKTE
jgi:tetratricopeptide (TPR) repeat protein